MRKMAVSGSRAADADGLRLGGGRIHRLELRPELRHTSAASQRRGRRRGRVPAEIDGYTVDVIGVSVFSSEAITSLTLPETVLELRSNAVAGCENMTRHYSASEPGRHQPNELFFQLHIA